MKRESALVICPGRGTYNKDELGYLQRYHPDKSSMIECIDDYRRAQQQKPIRELDAMDKYSMRTHTAGENASALIYGCALGDFLSIDRHRFDIQAVTGNSMGWYIAMACAGALSDRDSIRLINTMGSMMAGGIIGGQMIYPRVDENWQADKALEADVQKVLAGVNELEGCELYTSIELGGYIVFGGNEAGLAAAESRLPRIQERYPMRLFNHAAFHTPLLRETSAEAMTRLGGDMFRAPELPMVDGQGHIWQPFSTEPSALRHYTLATQVYDSYHFSKAVEVSVKEFAPDRLIILGPGNTLGGAVAQALININWRGLSCKSDFIQMQKTDPYILAMGMEAQRSTVVAET